MKHLVPFTVLAAALLGTGPIAGAQNAASAPTGDAVATATPATAGTLRGGQFPKVAVRWACDECTQNDKVAPLIIRDYEKLVSQSGYTVSDAETAEIVITEYRQRPPAARVMLGMLAGQDKLATKVIFRGKEYKADDYSLNTLSGMNSLCASVAKITANHLLKALRG